MRIYGKSPSIARPNAPVTTIVAATSLPSANNVDITDIPTGFSSLVLSVSGASMDTATRNILLRVSTDNGSSFDSTNYNMVVREAGVADTSGTSTLAQIVPTQGTGATASAAFVIQGYESGPFAVCTFVGDSSDGSPFFGTGVFLQTGRINALRLIMNSTGNFDAGTYSLHGIR